MVMPTMGASNAQENGLS